MTRVVRLGLAACLLACVSACDRAVSSTAGAPGVAVGIAIPSHVHAVAWIAADRGLFHDVGVAARVEVLGGSATAARSLLAGSTDVGLLGGDAVIKADAAGGDLVIVAGLVNRFYHRLVGRPGIDGVAALRGGRIGLPFFGGPQDMAVRYSLLAHGLRYGDDVEILSLGREMDGIAALIRGDIDATTSQTPPGRLAALGLTVLDDLPARAIPFPYMVVAVRREYLARHPDRVRAVLGALCRATAFYRDQPEASLALIAGHLHGSDTAGVAGERYDSGGPALISWPPTPDPAGLETVLDFLGPERARGLTPDSVVDLDLLAELRGQGECGGP